MTMYVRMILTQSLFFSSPTRTEIFWTEKNYREEIFQDKYHNEEECRSDKEEGDNYYYCHEKEDDHYHDNKESCCEQESHTEKRSTVIYTLTKIGRFTTSSSCALCTSKSSHPSLLLLLVSTLPFSLHKDVCSSFFFTFSQFVITCTARTPLLAPLQVVPERLNVAHSSRIVALGGHINAPSFLLPPSQIGRILPA